MADEALIVIDMQNDFCPGGALAVEGGDEIVPAVNRLIDASPHVVLTQDWHPAAIPVSPRRIGQGSVSDRGDALRRADALARALRPGERRCRFSSVPAMDLGGARHTQGLPSRDRQLFRLFRKRPPDPDRACGYLRERGIRSVTLCGLATDFCVAFSALDAVAKGFSTSVVLGACRGIDLNGSLAAMTLRMRDAGVRLI